MGIYCYRYTDTNTVVQLWMTRDEMIARQFLTPEGKEAIRLEDGFVVVRERQIERGVKMRRKKELAKIGVYRNEDA